MSKRDELRAELVDLMRNPNLNRERIEELHTDLLAVVDAAEEADREIRAYLHAYVVSELTVEQLCAHVLDSVAVLRADLARVTEGQT